MEDLIKKYHKNQRRNNGKVPYAVHLYDTKEILTILIQENNEITDTILISDLQGAALGHDLLEDTDVSEQEIIDSSSYRTLLFIKSVTNPDDDSHTERYMEKLKTIPEEAQLIKYADLIDNTLSVVYGLHDLGEEWTKNFYLPILKKTSETLASLIFKQYPKTAIQARSFLSFATDLLLTRLNKSTESYDSIGLNNNLN